MSIEWIRHKMRLRQLIIFGAGSVAVYCLFTIGRSTTWRSSAPLARPAPRHDTANKEPTIPLGKPKPITGGDNGGSHPIWLLRTEAERDFEAVRMRQSRTLRAAAAEYRRRYGLAPPPAFDKWFTFAKKRNVQLIDEFDTIMDLITPFWGLSPLTIRERAAEVLGHNNAVIAVQIRHGEIINIEGGHEWQQEAIKGMIKPFVAHLPDMDLAFNIHDEPRVVVPHDDMVRLVTKAKEVEMPAADANLHLRNSFSEKPEDLNDGPGLIKAKSTRFNTFAHQATWTHSRMSCPPDSPSRILEESERADDVAKYSLGELGFVYNVTAMTDICLSPSLSTSFGFFDRPNAFSVVHDLFPIFSQSKISSFADILYPSPWYWYDKVPYDELKDIDWNDKQDQLFWRGSTTGGFSRNGGWRRQHRQRFVQKMNAVDMAKILVKPPNDPSGRTWHVKEMPRGDFKDLVNVSFSHIGQCDPGDCDAQRQFFTVKGHAEQHDAWKYKYLVDIDGNAFSGRFYAFLKSKSLIYKLAIFREWHLDWLKPWVHYIPLSIQGDDWLESIRYFIDENLGKNEAESMAIQRRNWVNKVLRKEDMEVWFFRLLLEYGRIIDDNRRIIGFAP